VIWLACAVGAPGARDSSEGLGAVVSGRPGTSEKPSRPACASLNIVNYDVREPHSLGSTWRRQQNRTRSTRLTRTSNSSSDCPRREPPKSRVRSKETGICPDRTRLLVGRLNPRAGNRFCKNVNRRRTRNASACSTRFCTRIGRFMLENCRGLEGSLRGAEKRLAAGSQMTEATGRDILVVFLYSIPSL
jgi:hypothetical protein